MAKPKGDAEVQRKSQALERLSIEYVPVDQVRPNSYNPNRQSAHDFDLLTKSITEDGFTQPVVAVRITQAMIDAGEADGHPVGSTVIVDGEHRWRVAATLGMKEIPVAIVPMGLTQAKVATLRHNRARGSEDVELTADVLRDLEQLGALGWAQDSLAMDDVEMEKLLTDIPVPEQLADEDFGSAWVPGGDESEDSVTNSGATHSMTPAAIQATRDAEERAKSATTEGDRQQARRESDVQRFTFTYAGDEGREVRAVLGTGDSPAQRVLDLCRAEIAAGRVTLDEPEIATPVQPESSSADPGATVTPG